MIHEFQGSSASDLKQWLRSVGSRVYVVFTAPWCPSCPSALDKVRRQAPDLKRDGTEVAHVEIRDGSLPGELGFSSVPYAMIWEGDSFRG